MAIQATSGVTRITEGVHQSVLGTLGVPGDKATGQTRFITGLVYRNVHNVTQLVGKSLDVVLGSLEPHLEALDVNRAESPKRESLMAALNGVMGDRLAVAGHSFATPMTLRFEDEVLDWGALPPMPEAKSRVVLMIHGLCMTDLHRHARHHGHESEHGEAVSSALGHTPVYLHYNSGLHTSVNGRELSAQLEQLVKHWPVEIEELSVVAYSMGGLLIRSAFEQARAEGLLWSQRLKNIVFLGTPHHGSSLERLGNWTDVILESTPYTRPFAALGQLRSAGITDLRYGHVVDADWQGQDRFQAKVDDRQPVPLPDGVDCYSIAASMSAKRSQEVSSSAGDGLVSLSSALGHHKEAQRDLGFSKQAQQIIYETNHLGLLSNGKVTRQIIEWLGTDESG